MLLPVEGAASDGCSVRCYGGLLAGSRMEREVVCSGGDGGLGGR